MQRLLIPLLLAVGLIGPLLVSTWYSFSQQRDSLNQANAFEADQIIRTLANGMVDPVWNLIPEAGRPLISSLLEDSHVVSIEVESTAQGPFLSAETVRPAPGSEVITLERDIVRNGRVIGVARVVLDAAPANAAMDAQWRRILLAGGSQAIIVFAIILWVFRLNSRLQRSQMLDEINRDLEQQVRERRLAEEEVSASRDQLRLITDNLPVVIAYFDSRTCLQFANRAWEDWHRRSAADFLNHDMLELMGPQYEKLRPRVKQVLAGRRLTFEENLTYSDGKTRRVRVDYVPHKAASGSIEGFFTLIEDITEITESEQRLRQAQKMEAVGQLTGGVAHDFNNLLAVIQGNAELLAEKIGAGDAWLSAIRRAAGRGNELTQRLLAYSRQQPLHPQSIDMSVLVNDMKGLLQRTLGETITVQTAMEPALWHVLADAGQVENAILNLAINARDAMPGGGVLLLRCFNVRLSEADVERIPETAAGDYVGLAVSDTGLGMAEDVLTRAFEPFFTTKAVGQGSGLGLSMVQGFTRQSGGHVAIASKPGEGTTVTLYLPRADQLAVAADLQSDDAPTGKAEQILVIEDDLDVRVLTVEMLTGLGYRVIDVPDAIRADAVLARGQKIDLVLTDVVLSGGKSGLEFATAAKRRHPGLRVVFMSGYSADSVPGDSDHQFAGSGIPLLNKPFQRKTLARTIGAALAQD